jgi:hypothetical protein
MFCGEKQGTTQLYIHSFVSGIESMKPTSPRNEIRRERKG